MKAILFLAALLLPAGLSAQTDRSWSGRFGRPGLDGEVRALAVYQGQLVAGGAFGVADSIPLAGLARWDGSAWQPLGDGPSRACVGGISISGFAPYNGELVATGYF